MELLRSREVPLGGLRSMTVLRSLPQRSRTTIGPWCFIDSFGPDRVQDVGGMQVDPHPHLGLQTLSWLLQGQIEHRDSIGSHSVVEAGAASLMTAGSGISHSERSTPQATFLHGVQFWLALPDESRACEPGYRNLNDLPVVELPSARATVMVGEWAGARATESDPWPVMGAQVELCDSVALLELDTDFEHGVLAVEPGLSVEGLHLERGDLMHLPVGTHQMRIAGEVGTRCMLIGGKPWEEPLVMWWNLIGRSHDEIVAARMEYENGMGFGTVVGDPAPQIPAPEMPHVQLKPRPPAQCPDAPTDESIRLSQPGL